MLLAYHEYRSLNRFADSGSPPYLTFNRLTHPESESFDKINYIRKQVIYFDIIDWNYLSVTRIYKDIPRERTKIVRAEQNEIDVLLIVFEGGAMGSRPLAINK